MLRVRFRRSRNLVILTTTLLLLALFIAFQISVRLLTPDTLSYHVSLSNNGETAVTQSGTITDQQTIAEWRTQMTRHPSGRLLIDTLNLPWQAPQSCAPLSVYSATYTFRWHGLPIEVVSTLPSCGPEYMITSGGLPDLRTFFIAPLTTNSYGG